MEINCPFCGNRDLSEYAYIGDAERQIPALSDPEPAWASYVWTRRNPRGLHREHWQHSFGCRQFLVVDRDTATHEIQRIRMAGPFAGEAP
jgi:sarcosine oxidase subunit delta